MGASGGPSGSFESSGSGWDGGSGGSCGFAGPSGFGVSCWSCGSGGHGESARLGESGWSGVPSLANSGYFPTILSDPKVFPMELLSLMIQRNLMIPKPLMV